MNNHPINKEEGGGRKVFELSISENEELESESTSELNQFRHNLHKTIHNTLLTTII
jgi:hypothetical protein